MDCTESSSIVSGYGPLVFAVNGERFELSTLDPNTTLLEFLRYHTSFKSVKLSCGEGGCGACVVLLSKYDPESDRVEDFTVSSCLTLVCSVNRCSITTSEGLGNLKSGFHPIHQRFTGFHASQCGFCTPGMCVSLFSAITNAEKTSRPDPPPGFSNLTVTEAEKGILGNLCRCTGYRAIADACKSFAADVDIEDLGFNSFWRKEKEECKEVKANRLPFYDRTNEICTFPEFLKKEIRSTNVSLDLKTHRWLSPSTIEELKNVLKEHGFEKGGRTKLLAGNTGTGYYKDVEQYNRYIDLRYIAELSMIKMSDTTGLLIGAVVTISKVIEALKSGEFPTRAAVVFRKLSNHMEKIAAGFVRNTASIGGNLVMAQRKNFPSDLTTILLAVNSTVEVIKTGPTPGQEKLTLEEFLEKPPLDSDSVLLNVEIPYQELNRSVSCQDNTTLLFETYRAAPRPLGNALPYLNAAFLAEVSRCDASNGVLVNSCRMAFGAYGTKHSIRARKVEDFLTGKVINPETLYEAMKLVRASVVPEDGTKHSAYRLSLAVGFMFKFFSPFIDSVAENSISFSGQFNHEKVPNVLLSSGKQVIESSKEYYPVGEPITKSGATLQASGEAVYVDDIPSPLNCLYGSFIYSTEPLARINGIKLAPIKQPNGVVKVFTFRDVPEFGKNEGAKTIFGTEPLFSEDLSECAGQRVALVVADTQKHADMAAKLAVIDYGLDDLPPPILSVEEAVRRSSFFDVPPFLSPKPVGDVSKGMAEADHKIVSGEIKLGSQYYFYMETQTALAVPDEDNCMVVYSSSQCPEYAHSIVATCLGVPEHNVRVISRRVGGGFGGKAIKSMPTATACALAAHDLKRPVRTYLNRKTDMIISGGRHPMKITYSVGFKSDGKITALDLEILINAGSSADISLIIPFNIVSTLKKYDWGALSFDIKVCKTNQSSKSAMRGPGEVQGSYIAEAIIEHVASFLSVEVDSVRHRNLHTFESLAMFYELSEGEAPEYILPSIWDKLATSSSLDQRTQLISEFNKNNKWIKRGLSRVPVVHEVLLRATPGKVSILKDGSIVVEVGGIELGQGLWTKVKQAVAFALSLIGCEGTESLLDKVRVVQADTLSLIQGGFTAGSTTSEASCEAVRLCCNTLVERLTPVKEKLNGPVKWETLVTQGYMQYVNFSASSLYVPSSSSRRYLIYGAAVSEVEINLLTGETTILQVDIVYDCGQSLNPAVDLGQIEGAFVQGIGFFMLEEYLTDSKGLLVSDSTFTYKIPSLDTIPRQFNVEIMNSGHNKKRILSSKASGEPPLLLASSVHCATRAAIKEARKQILSWSSATDETDSTFQLDVPAIMPVVKELCGLDIVEKYLEWTARKADGVAINGM